MFIFKKINIISNEDKSFHQFNFGLICRYFTGVGSQGPASQFK